MSTDDHDHLRISFPMSYTEATHTAYADVSGAEPITAGSRDFTPERVTVKYHWRTQLGDEGWTIGNIEVSGRWVDLEREGSGMVILRMDNAPAWARNFAQYRKPTNIALTGVDTTPRPEATVTDGSDLP